MLDTLIKATEDRKGGQSQGAPAQKRRRKLLGSFVRATSSMAEFLIDTNVFSRIFTGSRDLKSFVETLDAAIDTVVYVECLQGSKSNREKQIVESYLARFEFCHPTSSVSKRTIDLIRTYSNTHGRRSA